MTEFDFVILKRSYTFAECPKCEGKGFIEKTFRKMKFVPDCDECHGEGRKRFPKSEEVNLLDALKELNISINQYKIN